jgi:hypothetical protein
VDSVARAAADTKENQGVNLRVGLRMDLEDQQAVLEAAHLPDMVVEVLRQATAAEQGRVDRHQDMAEEAPQQATAAEQERVDRRQVTVEAVDLQQALRVALADSDQVVLQDSAEASAAAVAWEVVQALLGKKSRSHCHRPSTNWFDSTILRPSRIESIATV